MESGEYRGSKVTRDFGLVVIETPNGPRVVLPPVLWTSVMKECHDSVWTRHLRAPHTYALIAQTYWWPNLSREVKHWVAGCQLSKFNPVSYRPQMIGLVERLGRGKTTTSRPECFQIRTSMARSSGFVEPAVYDNYLVEQEDVEGDPEQFIAHASFLVRYHSPSALLETFAADIEAQLEQEGAIEFEDYAWRTERLWEQRKLLALQPQRCELQRNVNEQL
ncbi:unnamed protein product [Phytophthora fragariaefolia]|uniref:Unnamed protein product n=1 Tax=Phytophthora fragariaefolia TaxID=1490495 RepID=A0A9W7CSH6_9STRA|nr:unnamed protein product [Phytophthora fragariaefolia]